MKQRIVIELVPLPDSRPVEQRLRAALKTLLRRDRLRLVECHIEQPDTAGGPPDGTNCPNLHVEQAAPRSDRPCDTQQQEL
jgi:hypothetical protein